jgi:genome maintenance exonuclease 1
MKFCHLNDLSENGYELSQREERDGKRVYITPNGNVYPSITSILGSQPKPGIEVWRRKVGEDEANRIVKDSSKLGTAVHDLCEQYLYNLPLKCNNPEAVEVFNRLRFRLKNINNIYGLEIPLHSDMLRVAGTADCIAEYNGVLSLIDFKTSRRAKKEDWIEDYYIQTMFYAAAFYEMVGALPEQVVILIAVRDSTEVQTFTKPIKELDKYMDKLLTIMKKSPSIIQQD